MGAVRVFKPALFQAWGIPACSPVAGCPPMSKRQLPGSHLLLPNSPCYNHPCVYPQPTELTSPLPLIQFNTTRCYIPHTLCPLCSTLYFTLLLYNCLIFASFFFFFLTFLLLPLSRYAGDRGICWCPCPETTSHITQLSAACPTQSQRLPNKSGFRLTLCTNLPLYLMQHPICVWCITDSLVFFL